MHSDKYTALAAVRRRDRIWPTSAPELSSDVKVVPRTCCQRADGPERKTFLRGVAGLVAIGLLLSATAACGTSSNGSAPQICQTDDSASASVPTDSALGTDAPSVTVAPSSQQTTASATAPADHVIKFSYTNTDGWHYAGQIPLPQVTLKLGKDISSSPPGQAKATATLAGDTSVAQQRMFTDDNPGRSGGPTLTIGIGYLAYKLPEDIDLGGSPNGPNTIGPCYEDDGGNPPYSPWDQTLYCGFNETGISGIGSPQDEPEAMVDKFAASDLSTSVYAFSLASPSPVGMGNGVNSCNIFVSLQTYDVSYTKSYSDPDSQCGKAQITVSGA